MEKKSRTEYSVLNIVTGLGGYAVNTVVGLICRMIFTRTLSADYLGVSGLFTNILTMLSLAELGIGSAIVYALYKPLATDDREKIASLVHFYGKCYQEGTNEMVIQAMLLVAVLGASGQQGNSGSLLRPSNKRFFVCYVLNSCSSRSCSDFTISVHNNQMFRAKIYRAILWTWTIF